MGYGLSTLILSRYRVSPFELVGAGIYTRDLFAEEENIKYKLLSKVSDQVNAKYRRYKVFQGTLGFNRDWLPKHVMRSKAFTTDINELMIVN